MPIYLNEYVEKIKRNLGNPRGYQEEVYEDSVQHASRIYSRYRPREIVTDITGSGFNLNLPSSFVDGFSSVQSVEFPYLSTNQNPSYLKESSYRLYRSPTGVSLRLIGNSMTSSQVLRLTFTAPHEITVSTSTIPVIHEDAVANLATSVMAEVVAAEFSNVSRSSMDDVAVDFRNKAIEWQIIADRYMFLFRRDLGLRDDEQEAVHGWTDLDSGYSWGGDHLTHPNVWR